MAKTKVIPTVPLFEIKKIQSDFPKEQIRNSNDCYQFIRKFYGDDMDIYESFFILLLNRANRTIGFAKISQGGVTGTVVDAKIIAFYVAQSLSCAVVIAHNHPSGNLTPSEKDIELTKKIAEMLPFLDSKIVDHIILSSEGYYSFADNGLL